MPQHRENVEDYPGSLSELATDIGDLRYDALCAFLRLLSAKLASDADADARRDRPRLAASLRGGAAAVQSAAEHIEQAWTIRAPHMR